MNFQIEVNGDDVIINGNLHTFDGSGLTKKCRILSAIARELGFKTQDLFIDLLEAISALEDDEKE